MTGALSWCGSLCLVKISATDAGCFADRDFCDFSPGYPRVHDADEFFTFSKILAFIRSFSVIDFRTSVCTNFFSSSRSLYHIWPSFDTGCFCHVVYISRSQLWNRRHLDFMIRSSRLQFPLSPICGSFVLLRHQVAPYFLTDALNSYFEQAGVPHFRLLHLPLLWDRQQLLQQFEHEGLILLDFRPQLSRRSQL